jgi:hypothetical protein
MMWSPEETVLSWGDSFVLERQLFFGRYSFSTVCLSYQEKGGTGLHPACILNGIIFSSSKNVLCLESSIVLFILQKLMYGNVTWSTDEIA